MLIKNPNSHVLGLMHKDDANIWYCYHSLEWYFLNTFTMLLKKQKTKQNKTKQTLEITSQKSKYERTMNANPRPLDIR